MKERITEKINNIVDYILSKDVSDITYAEYKILECREKDLKYWEEQEQKSKNMSELLLNTFGGSYFPLPSTLPEPSIDNTNKEV